MRALPWLLLIWALVAPLAAEKELSKEQRFVCTLEHLEGEGARRLKAPHLKGHFAIPRQCQTLSFYEYSKDERLSQRVRAMPIRKLLEYVNTGLGLSDKLVGSLKVLKFGHCGIHDDDIPILLKIFQKAIDWKNLQEIHLNGNHLTDKGAKTLIDALNKFRKKLSGMRELHLDNNRIGNDGMQAVLHYARNYPGFRQLYLSQNPAWSPIQNKKLGEVLQWMPITEKSNIVKSFDKRGQLIVHVGGPSVVLKLVEASASMKAGAPRTSTTDREATPPVEEKGGWIDSVARLEIALLEKGLPGARSMLSEEHASAVRRPPAATEETKEGDKEGESGEEEEKGESIDWEAESLQVMTAFVSGCVRNPALFSSQVEDAEELADHLMGLGCSTPSMLLQIHPEDLKSHLSDSPDVVVKLLMRCTCEYYPKFIKRVEVAARAASEAQVTISDLLDDPRAMHMNQGEGPLFKRTKKSVRYAGNRIANLGTGQPHQTWLPYRHTDHHLSNIEPSLHERTLSDRATRARASRQVTPSKKLDFSGRAGINEDYSGAMQSQKYGVTRDVMWHRSYCASPYYRLAKGVAAGNDGEAGGSPKQPKVKNKNASGKRKAKTKRRNRHGLVQSDEL